MINEFFMVRYALLYHEFSEANSDAIRTKDKYYIDLRNEKHYKLMELAYTMCFLLGFDNGAKIRDRAITMSNTMTKTEIKAKLEEITR